ncbi:pyridoxamine 5'-phosphate oxidase family protein [Aurantiacibacter gangjinensis]|uniref:Flavin-binding protein n=1 Tax=Aurantiacibacter gangjinensis TaxID=502682 RepID=A0A0G9MRL5_9SPHN|nr:pyridoxamine 5'-phosphate oxidase family protein [Aurantiacibacter gangjinensis]APE29095.1 Pyridoxamine 5'-phosphate oxidase [Aurantiacibacter gangjinensis]KLE33184.1 flavin-binding protein [Aurantiacibacter gangjinensis]
MIEDLDFIREDIASRLAEGANSRHSAFHTPVVATADADARVMVLRGFDADSWTLLFHTDARSPKVAVIGEGGPVGVLSYDRKAKLQMRCRGTGRIERDTPLADAAWEESTTFARRCYLGEGPGTVSDQPTSGLPDWAEGIQPTPEQVAPARDHFAILLVQLESVDWLHLANAGHRRAVWDVAAGEGRWIAP